MKRRHYLSIFLAIALVALYTCEIEKPEKPEKPVSNQIVMDAPELVSPGYNELELKTNIYIDTSQKIVDHGYCWDTEEEPEKEDNYVSFGVYTYNEEDFFINKITGLQPGVTYFIRAYAQYNETIIYGDELEVTTTQPGSPVVTTLPVTEIGETTAKSGGLISEDGGYAITKRGVCWSTTSNGQTAASAQCTEDGTGTGSFTSEIRGLSPETDYYVKAYATNNNGTSFGNEIQFTTSSEPLEFPVVTTDNIVELITSSSARSGGTVVSQGSSPVYQRGVCYGTSLSNLDIDHTHTNNGSGPGHFYSNMLQLEPNTQYYVKAYATNENDLTSYGEVLDFITKPPIQRVLFYSNQDLSLNTSYERKIRDAINNDPNFFIEAEVNSTQFAAMNQSSDFDNYDVVVICESGGSNNSINYGASGANFPKPTLCLEPFVVDDWFGASIFYVNAMIDPIKAGTMIVKNSSHPIWQRMSVSGGTQIAWSTGLNDDSGNALLCNVALDSLTPPNAAITNSSTLLASNMCLADNYGTVNNGHLWAIESNSTCPNRLVIWGIHTNLLQYSTASFMDVIISSLYWLAEIEE